jgi:hypothetical protein
MMIKKICQILKLIYVAVFGFFFLYIFSTAEKPQSKWKPEVKYIRLITVEPRHDGGTYKTVRNSFSVNSDQFCFWVKAIQNGVSWGELPSKWGDANRKASSRTLQLKIEYTDDQHVIFDIWIYDSYALVKYEEKYEGTASHWHAFPTKYSQELRQLIDNLIGSSSDSWGR